MIKKKILRIIRFKYSLMSKLKELVRKIKLQEVKQKRKKVRKVKK